MYIYILVFLVVTPVYRVWCVVTWCDVGRVMEMMEMLTGTSVIRMGIYRDHGAMQIQGDQGEHAIIP